MTGNMTPWIILTLIVVASLVWKGYLKVPSSTPRPSGNPPPQPTSPAAASPAASPFHDSAALGLMFAQAVRREAEQEVAYLIAKEANDRIKATFQAPFSPPVASPTTGGSPSPGVHL